jgi:hypothetical protein
LGFGEKCFHEDIKTTLVYAKADTRLLRDAIQSLEALGRNGYKMGYKNRERRTEAAGRKDVNCK